MTAATPASRPLHGVRVVSFAEQFPGPFATMILSDLGADVIQVERPVHGDPARAYPAFYAALNRGRRSVAIDLKDEAQRVMCRRLIDTADVVFEGFRPGVMARLGLDFHTCAQASPSTVYVSVSGFGQDGPLRDRPAHDLSFQALAGLIDLEEPRVPTLSWADLSAGAFAAIAALAGLASRVSTGVGGYWDVSMFDSLVSLMTPLLGPVANGDGLGSLGQDPGYGLFATADGKWLTLSIAFEDHFWKPLCDRLDLARFRDISGADRPARRDELRLAVAQRIAGADAAHWESVLTEAGVPCGVVNRPLDVLDNPQVVARDMVQRIGDGAGTYAYVRQPLVVDGRRLGPTRPAPSVGQHTAEILRELS